MCGQQHFLEPRKIDFFSDRHRGVGLPYIGEQAVVTPSVMWEIEWTASAQIEQGGAEIPGVSRVLPGFR